MEPTPDVPVEQCLTLNEVSRIIASRRNLSELFHDLAEWLHRLLDFSYLGVMLYDPARHVMRLHNLEGSPRGPLRPGAEFAVEDIPSGWVWQHQEPLVISDLERETRFPRATQALRDYGLGSFCSLPLSTAHRRLGTLTMGRPERGAYSPPEVAFAQLVAAQVAVAVDNALHSQEAQALQQQLARERDRLQLLLEVTNSVMANLELRDVLRAVSATLRRVMHCDVAGVILPDAERHQLRVYALDFPDSQGFIREETLIPIEGSLPGRAFQTGKPVVVDRSDPAEDSCLITGEGLQSHCFLPLISRHRGLGVLGLGKRQEQAFTQDDVEFLTQVANQVAIAVENALAYGQIAALKDQLAQEKLYLEDEIRSEMHFEDIVGKSAALHRVLQQVETVAPTDATVLISGETGTGKELIARAIHQLSPRRSQAFVKLNCAAIPAGLLESELFGHERGAFTGAIAQRIGRFELANRGTVFLDEIGELPLELQPKLLRVLQDREFERLGSPRTLRTDARLIAATNRDLAALVDAQQFRADLFYRVNVFPVHVPPLRERPEDIPLLVRHFAQQFARRLGKTIETIPSDTMQGLLRYPWPGNIRELQNIIERAVILSPGPVLQVPLADLKPPATGASPQNHNTLEEAERKHILAVLEETKWVLSGPNGAAVRLGMKRSTLQFRMRKLGIARPGGSGIHR
ncbi:MAG TPA: sigma 54-interacting transcriptional regulator [Candidatus Tectomicrobia bacterium]|nr:sigma 54-interacting transcriptional regulator [Candidatus Tectomicrobia bacterium]